MDTTETDLEAPNHLSKISHNVNRELGRMYEEKISRKFTISATNFNWSYVSVLLIELQKQARILHNQNVDYVLVLVLRLWSFDF